MKTFRVSWEIEVDARTPIHAAQTAQRWIKDENSLSHIYYVQEDADGSPVVSVDLDQCVSCMVLPVFKYVPIIQ